MELFFIVVAMWFMFLGMLGIYDKMLDIQAALERIEIDVCDYTWEVKDYEEEK